jgi:ribosomal protein L23
LKLKKTTVRKEDYMTKKSQSLIAGIIFAVVFAGLFFILMRYGDLNRITGHDVKDATGMAEAPKPTELKIGDIVTITKDKEYTVNDQTFKAPDTYNNYKVFNDGLYPADGKALQSVKVVQLDGTVNTVTLGFAVSTRPVSSTAVGSTAPKAEQTEYLVLDDKQNTYTITVDNDAKVKSEIEDAIKNGYKVQQSGSNYIIIMDENNKIVYDSNKLVISETKGDTTTNYEYVGENKDKRIASINEGNIKVTPEYATSTATSPKTYLYEYTDEEGSKKVRIDANDYKDIQSTFGTSNNLVMEELIKSGTTDYVFFETTDLSNLKVHNGIVTLGDTTIEKLNDNSFVVKTGLDAQTSTYDSIRIINKDGTVQQGTGNVKLDSLKNIVLDPDSELKTFNKDGKLVKYKIMDENGKSIETIWNPDESIESGRNSFSKPNPDGYREYQGFYYKNGQLYQKNADGNYVACTSCSQDQKDAAADLYQAENVKSKEETGWTIDQQIHAGYVHIFEGALEGWGGLNGFSSLIFSDEQLQGWRYSVDRIFAENYLGTQYWASGICSKHIDRLGEGLMYVNAPSGMIEVGAHVEAERIDYVFENGSQNKQYLYRISFYVSNPNGVNRRPQDRNPTIQFNVAVSGDRTVNLYNQYINLDEGDSWSRVGAQSVVQYSTHYYDQICIRFASSVLTADGKTVSNVCNRITTHTGGAEGYGQETSSGTEGSGEITENAI